jgi:hypothetical protein
MAIGLAIYFSYGRWHSVLARKESLPATAKVNRPGDDG